MYDENIEYIFPSPIIEGNLKIKNPYVGSLFLNEDDEIFLQRKRKINKEEIFLFGHQISQDDSSECLCNDMEISNDFNISITEEKSQFNNSEQDINKIFFKNNNNIIKLHINDSDQEINFFKSNKVINDKNKIENIYLKLKNNINYNRVYSNDIFQETPKNLTNTQENNSHSENYFKNSQLAQNLNHIEDSPYLKIKKQKSQIMNCDNLYDEQEDTYNFIKEFKTNKNKKNLIPKIFYFGSSKLFRLNKSKLIKDLDDEYFKSNSSSFN